MNRRNTIGLAAALAAVLGIGAATTAAATIHVPGDYPTIQAAINAAVAGDEVVVAPGTYYENINFLGKAITVRSSGGALVTTIDGQNLGTSVRMTTGETTASVLRGFRITGGGVFAEWCSPTIQQCMFASISGQYAPALWLKNTSAQVSDCTFWNNTGWDGGAITVFGGDVIGTPRLEWCTFQYNHAQNYGGAIHVADASCRLTVTGCFFHQNSAQNEGGAIQFARSSATTLQDCTFTGNSAGWGGGTLQIIGQSSPTLTDCSFAENTVLNNGGSVIVRDSSLASFARCTFSQNSASVGGALYLTDQSQSTFHDCVFLNNFATYAGGAVYADGTTLTAFSNGLFKSNEAPSAGAVFVGSSGAALTIEDCTFEDNGTPAYGLGGAIRVGWGGHASITGSTFTSNRADGGGAICVNDNSIATIDQSTFSGNTADWDGGALKVAWGSTATITACAFSGNNASQNHGGAIINHGGGQLIATGCTFSDNQSDSGGGAIFSINPDTRLTVEGSTFVNNSSGYTGGAVEVHQSEECSFKNCRFVGNSSGYGGALKADGASIPMVMVIDGCVFGQNHVPSWGAGSAVLAGYLISGSRVTGCTIVENTGTGGALRFDGLDILDISNCILHENRSFHGGPLEHIGGWGTVGVSYSLVQGGYPGEGNIDADPLFYDPENGDYRPGAGSPCIDAGSNALVPPELTTDLDGWPRIVDGDADGTATVDMGAYEAQDCNGNAVPDFQDIAQGTSADLNENGIPDDCEDQTCTNLTTGQTYPTIAEAIAAAQNGHHLRAAPPAYTITPTIDFAGKQVLLDSSGEIVQPRVGLINITNNADLATAAGQGLTVRGTLRSANNATADVTAGSLAVVENATLRARLGSTLSVETTVGSTLGGTTYVEANATLNFTGPVTNTATVTAVTNATFSVMDNFVNAGTFGTLQSNVILATATNAGTMNLPNVSLLADELVNAEAGQLTGYGQLYTDLTNAGDLTIVNNTTLVGNVWNQSSGLIVLQLGTTTLVGTLTNDGGLVGQFGGRGGALDIVGDFVAGPGATLSIPAGSRLSVTGHYDAAIDDSSRYVMSAATLQLRGAARTQYLEVMSRNRGPSPDGLDPELAGSYPLGTLHIGPSAAIVQLVDNHDNDGLGQAACEAIYADTVLIDAGTTLINPTCKIYYNTLVNQGTVTHPEHLVQIREHIPGDLNGDGVVNLSDLAQLLAHYGMTGGATYEMGDIDGDGDVDLSDLAALLGNYGMGA